MPIDEITQKAIRDALSLEKLRLPHPPDILDVVPEEYTDFSGEEALRVYVILSDDTDENQLTGDRVLQIKSAIHESLLERGIDRFPYVFLIKKGEYLQR